MRKLVPILADNAGDAGFCAIRDLVLGRARTDMPQAAALDILSARLWARQPARRARSAFLPCSTGWCAIVTVRSVTVPLDMPRDFYSRMGGALLTGVAELLGRMDDWPDGAGLHRGRTPLGLRSLADRTLCADRRGGTADRISGAARVGHPTATTPRADLFRRTGPTSHRRERPSLVEVAAPSEYLPRPSLHPLVIYDPARSEILFLNAQRDRQRTEYLCYTTGEHVEHREWGDELRVAGPRRGGLGREHADRAVGRPIPGRGRPARAQVPELIGPQARRIGEFELLSELGRGNMGKVYRSWNPPWVDRWP